MEVADTLLTMRSPVVDGVAITPCERCKANNLECVIGSSNRGGRRVRKRTADQAQLDDDSRPESPTLDSSALEFGHGP